MSNKILSTGFPEFHHAEYEPHEIPGLCGNPLAEALKRPLSPEEWLDAIAVAPKISLPKQREMSTTYRTILAMGLRDCCIPLSRHAEIFNRFEAMKQYGYLGRVPHTKGHNDITNDIHKNLKNRLEAPHDYSITPPVSAVLTGPSGMGKTTIIKRWMRREHEVIFHPTLNVYQIPVLLISTPPGGVSTKSLLGAILLELDRILKITTYYSDCYDGKRITEKDLLVKVAHILNQHCVGLIIFDEIQRLALSITRKLSTNERKGEILLSLLDTLVLLCDAIRTPMAFVGTNDASKLFSQSIVLGRRGTGIGKHTWERLTPGPEFSDLFQILWKYQVVRQPIPYSQDFENLFYEFSQGLIDVLIGLFIGVQVSAMLDGTEKITVDLIKQKYESDFTLLHDGLAAIRGNSLEDLKQYPDAAPEPEQYANNIYGRHGGFGTTPFSLSSTDETFSLRIETALIALGIPPNEAEEVVKKINMKEENINLLSGAQSALKVLNEPPKKPTSKSKASGISKFTMPENSNNKILRALRTAHLLGVPNLEIFRAEKISQPLHQLLDSLI